MSGLQRATVYGFSLWEMEVFGACPGTSPTPPTTTPPTTPPTQPPGTYPGWAPNTFYAVGTRVSYSGLDYQCLQQHTSIVSWEPTNAASLWQRL